MSRAHAVSGQKSKAHMERKGKSIHRFRLFTAHSGAARCPRRAEGGMAAGRGSPGTATRPLCGRRDGEDPKKMDTRCSHPYLPGKPSMMRCRGLCIGEGLCFWETPGQLEGQPWCQYGARGHPAVECAGLGRRGWSLLLSVPSWGTPHPHLPGQPQAHLQARWVRDSSAHSVQLREGDRYTNR